MNMTILKAMGKIAVKGLAAVGILGVSALGIKVANDFSNSAYKDCKQVCLQNGRKIKNEFSKKEDEE